MIQKHHHPVYTWFDKTLQEATFRFPPDRILYQRKSMYKKPAFNRHAHEKVIDKNLPPSSLIPFFIENVQVTPKK